MVTKSEIEFALLKQETVSTPMVLPSSLKEIKSLVFQYQNQQSEATTFLPLPDLVSAPKMLVTLENEVAIPTIIEKLVTLSDEIYKPKSCASKEDVVGQLDIFVKALRPLSLVDLKAVEAKLEARITSLRGAQRKVIRTLFYDVVAMIGTNPAIMLVKERLLDTTKIDTVQAVSMIQAVFASVRTPTSELLKELITFVKVGLKPLAHERTMLYNIVLVQASNLLYKACMAPARFQTFPVRVYGEFCTPTSEPMVQWIEFLKQELVAEQNQQIKLNIVTAIGKLGHLKSVEILKPIITNVQYNEMVRSLAIYSLQRVAVLEPAHVKPILMSIIENIAERPEVRIAAVSVLPYAQPTVAELKMIAVRTWLEPSKQVASFIYSTLRSLTVTEVPELKPVGLRVHSIMSLVKPVVFNMQYAQNLHFAKLVNYLEMIAHQEISWVASPESFIPARMSVNALLYGQDYALQGAAFTAYTRGMDKWIDLIMKYTMNIQTSAQVQTQLNKITEELGIVNKPAVASEIFAQFGLLDTEVTAYLNEPMVVEALLQVADELNRDMESFLGEKTFEITKALKPLEVEDLGPCDAGFPIYIERSLPMAVALKGHTQMELEEVGGIRIPKKLRAKVVPAVNVKFEMNMGVISPFTQELIGTGLTLGSHLVAPLEMIATRETNQVTLDIKIPEEIQGETCMFHASVTPFTYKKNLRLLTPITKAASLKPILSGVPLKTFNMNIGAPLDIDARVVAESDAKYTDLYSYLEKIRQHNPISLVHTAILPSTIRRNSFRVVFNPVTSRTKAVSVTVEIIAKPTNQVPTTEEMATFCSKAMPHAKCQENLIKTMSSLGSQATTLALRLDAKLVGTTKALSTAITFGYKLESTTIKDILKLVTHVELLAPFMHPFEVKLASTAEIPRVNILWNKKQLLQQALEVVFNGQVEFGRVNQAKEIIKMKTLMIKTEQLKEAVRTSPEFLRCTQEEQLEHPLAEVCELVRHQAASVDEVRTEMVIPAFLPRLPIFDLIIPNVANVVKTFFIGHLIETPINHVSPTDLKVITKVNRIGDEAQLIIEYNGRRYG